MKPFDLIRLIFGNLNRRKARVALTAIGVVIGTAAVVILVSLAIGLQKNATEQLYGIGDLSQIQVSPGIGGNPVGPGPGVAVSSGGGGGGDGGIMSKSRSRCVVKALIMLLVTSIIASSLKVMGGINTLLDSAIHSITVSFAKTFPSCLMHMVCTNLLESCGESCNLA